jgi:hypothetical protein
MQQNLAPDTDIASSLSAWNPTFTCWFPHSGGRWLNRGLIGKHSQIASSEVFSPFLISSLDDLLNLDTTFQVHKSRTQHDRRHEFEAVVKSMEAGRLYGLQRYFYELLCLNKHNTFYAALPVGSKVSTPHFDTMLQLLPKMNLIHLVRNPIECFASLKSRSELGGDPCIAATYWLKLNYAIRKFWKTKPQQYQCIRYEDLCVTPKETASTVLAMMNLSWEESMATGIAEYHGRNQGIDIIERVTPEERNIIAEICAVEAANYGYILN